MRFKPTWMEQKYYHSKSAVQMAKTQTEGQLVRPLSSKGIFTAWQRRNTNAVAGAPGNRDE